MPAWVKPGSAGAASGGRQFYDTGSGGPSAMAPVYHPTPASGGSGQPLQADQTPGSVTINPLDPSASAKSASEGLGSLFEGLKQAVFGNGSPGTGLLSPVIRHLAGPGFEQVESSFGHPIGKGIEGAAGAVGAGIGGVLSGIGSIAERIPTETGVQDQHLEAQYQALPEDFRAQYQKQIDAEHGLFGTGLFDNDNHFKSAAVRAYEQNVNRPDYKPGLFQGTFAPPATLADTVTNLMGLMGVQEQLVERGVAGMQKESGNRLNEARLLGKKANDVEQLAVAKVDNGSWTESEALDFLATHGAGFSHDAGLELAASVFLDPLTWETFGAGALAKGGAKGAELFARGEQAAQMAQDARVALKAAGAELEAAKSIGLPEQIATTQARYDEAVAKATQIENEAKAFDVYTGKTPRGANVLARIVQSDAVAPKTATLLKAIGKRYVGLEGTFIGSVAKGARTLIDPLHAIDLRMPGAARAVDLYSDALPRVIDDTLHPMTSIKNLELLRTLGPEAEQLYKQGYTAAAANRGREGVMELYRTAQVNGGLGAELMNATIDGRKIVPSDIVDEAAAAMKERDLLRWLRFDTVKNVLGPARQMTDAGIEELSHQLESMFHTPADEWLTTLHSMTVEQRAALKFAYYGHANGLLLAGRSASKIAGKIALGENSIDRLILIAKGTLTRIGANSLLDQIAAAKSIEGKLTLIADWQERYPILRFISIDRANAGKTIEDFTRWLEDRVDRLPMQVRHEELPDLHESLQALQHDLGDGYSLGFAPEDQFKWGLERANDAGGNYGIFGQPWVDHVGYGAVGYNPGRALNLNIVGHPIVDVPLKAAAKAIDYMESGARVMKAQVSGAQIAEVARQRFVSPEVRGKLAENGLTEGVANTWWERIQKYTSEQQGFSGPRGFSKGDLYNALFKEDLVPHTMLNGAMKLTENDVMEMIMRAYDGDMRYVGLTQKLSGRAKRVLFEATGSNFTGQIAEHAWPLMKFRFNPIFQLQEKIEPWVLNAQRGISFATGVKANQADLATERLLQRMSNYSLIRQGDVWDQAEYHGNMLFGDSYAKVASNSTSKLSGVQARAQSIMNVQGVKRLNMLRTFRSGLGRDMRAVWEEAKPGEWEQMKAFADIKAGRILDEDEFAVQMLGEQLYSNDIVVKRLGAALGSKQEAEFANAVKTGAWHTPASLGELQRLDLDHVAMSLQIPGADGRLMTDLADLRRYVAEDHGRLRNVVEGLNRLGADPDYVQRVSNALTFSWTGFWQTAAERFSLTKQESAALQDMVAGAAKLRDMDPSEFLSQVFHPGIREGAEGIIGEIGKAKDLRSVLAGTKGVATREDLVRQMAGVFSAYLDPSAKRALLMEFGPELRQAVLSGKIKLDLADIQDMWDAGAEGQLADRILGYMDGKLGIGDHALITDAARGWKAGREGATKYLANRGVTAQAERREYVFDPVVDAARADEYNAMAEVPFSRSGRMPNVTQVSKSGIGLKSRPAGVDERTYEAFHDFVIDNQTQFTHLTSTGKGGMGVKVTITKIDPYAGDLEALQKDLAKGKLRVFGGESDHPIMTNEQVVQYRANRLAFGHGADGHGFDAQGLQNADVAHAPLYSDTGRAAMWTQSQAEALRAATPTPQPRARTIIDPKRPIESFEEQHPFEASPGSYGGIELKLQGYTDEDLVKALMSNQKLRPSDYTGKREFFTQRLVGEGFSSLAKKDAHRILQQIADWQSEFPTLRLRHVDIPADFHEPVGTFSETGVEGFGLAETTLGATYAPIAGGGGVMMLSPTHFGSSAKARSYWAIHAAENEAERALNDLPFSIGSTQEAIQNHELGHVVDLSLRSPYSDDAYNTFIREFEDSGEADLMSRYGLTNPEEAAAELFVVAFSKTVDHAKVPVEIEQWAGRMRTVLTDMGIYQPLDGVGMKAAPRVGLLPQNVLDVLGEQFVGVGKHVESNPDVARTAQQFGKWTQAVIENGLLKGEQSIHAGILHDIAGIPTHSAAPYNLTEGLMVNAATQSMVNKWQDAFRLQYFAQDRSMIERSINHPMFGLYPASYMWGKLGPEMVRFLAQKPFGIRTGGLAYSIMDTQARIALQREYDPAFDAQIEKLGHSQALSFLGYLLPSLPWDINASAPIWMKDVASQGLKNQQLEAAGAPRQDINVLKPTVDVVGKLNPLGTTLPWMSRAAGEIVGAGDKQDLQTIVQEPVKAANISPALEQVIQELREALSR